MEWWGWLLAAAGGVVTLWNGFKALREVFAPYSKIKRDLVGAISRESAHEEEANERFEKLEATTQAMLTGLVALVNHEIDGNGIQGLKDARTELLNHIINR